ncbi:MAG: glutathionylspermidine synthase family protein [Alphaproteobacteria bacterium]|nr:glutathionylspermidine synthase family protein [Alphaproteobacteria bacterium]
MQSDFAKQRRQIAPRPDWEAAVKALGFDFATIDGLPYWDEGVCWRLTGAQVDALDDAAAELHAMCLDAVRDVIDTHQLGRFGITGAWAEEVQESWRRGLVADRPGGHVHGRFDLAFDGETIKLLEYNADTPTSLFEAGIVQWYWKEACHPGADQFNSLHEKLVARWADLLPGAPRAADGQRWLHGMAQVPHPEDETTVRYMLACAEEAGWRTHFLGVADIGWDDLRRRFVDLENQPITTAFKLYPWEWLAKEEFFQNLRVAATRWIEPAWKSVLSNKALLAVLWELHPEHPLLLPASFDRRALSPAKGLVRKPLLGREGANIALFDADGKQVLATDGLYGDEGYVWQERAPMAAWRDKNGDTGTAVFGVWVIGNETAGLGIREDQGLITRDSSRFVPHYFE